MATATLYVSSWKSRAMPMIGACLKLLGSGTSKAKVAVEVSHASGGLGNARLDLPDGQVLTQAKSILLRLIEMAGGAYTKTMLGADAMERSQVSQWLDYVARNCSDVAAVERASPALDIHFKKSTYVALDRLSVSDLIMYHAVYPMISVAPANKMRAQLPCLCRWFDLVQHDELFKSRDDTEYMPPLVNIVAKTDSAPPLGWTKFNVRATPQSAATKQNPAAPAKAAAQAAPLPPSGQGNNKKKSDNKEKKQKNKDGKGGKGGKGKKGAAAAPENAAPIDPANDAFFYAIDLRVGRINKAWEHEASEHLWCESIDVGEEKERQIASGLREYYKTKDDMEGRMVVVVCNLKSRKLGGFPSNGMVLAVKKGETCELVEAPPGSKPGDRLIAEGVLSEGAKPLDAAVPNKVAKKKLFEKFAPDLKTNSDCFVVWRGHKLGGARVPTNSDSQVS